MRRNANTHGRRFSLLPAITLIGILLCLPYSLFAQSSSKDRVVIKVKDASKLQTIASRYGLTVKKNVARGSGGLLVVSGPAARAIKDQIKADPDVAYIEDDKIVPLD